MGRRKHSPLTYARRITDEVRHHPSNRAHPVRAVGRALWWQAVKRIGRRPVDVEFAGMVLRCHPDSQSASNIWYFTPRYDHHEMLFVERYLRPGDAVLDVGGNIGTYSLLAASRTAPDGRVDAFEPDLANVRRLRENVALNGLADRVTVHEAAVADITGEVTFLTDFDVSNAIQRPGHRTSGGRQVTCVQLDEVVADPSRLALAKLDVEGAEVAALRGAEGLLGQQRPPVLLVEVLSHQLARFDTTWDDLRGLVGRHGYEPWTYDGDTARLAPVDGTPHGNCLFVAADHLEGVRVRLDEGARTVAATAPPVRRARGAR